MYKCNHISIVLIGWIVQRILMPPSEPGIDPWKQKKKINEDQFQSSRIV
jgi:hypothetical protein